LRAARLPAIVALCLAADVKVILTPPFILCVENH
jgi:hypothetical protein